MLLLKCVQGAEKDVVLLATLTADAEYETNYTAVVVHVQAGCQKKLLCCRLFYLF